ncbi:hypothetical protein GCM10023336_71870 [Streptomyces similanensis]|uniref:Uncharacterized protein n=1 Tax=Streptomyces similanensis TaxID=1274988 RepID=A0ABP9LMZ7_9ACTN
MRARPCRYGPYGREAPRLSRPSRTGAPGNYTLARPRAAPTGGKKPGSAHFPARGGQPTPKAVARYFWPLLLQSEM